MPAALRIDRDVVEVIDPGNIEGDVNLALDEGQVATGVVDLGQVDEANLAVIFNSIIHKFHSTQQALKMRKVGEKLLAGIFKVDIYVIGVNLFHAKAAIKI